MDFDSAATFAPEKNAARLVVFEGADKTVSFDGVEVGCFGEESESFGVAAAERFGELGDRALNWLVAGDGADHVFEASGRTL